MSFTILRGLRILIPALVIIITIWVVGWQFWKLVVLIITGLLYGMFMEAFGAYERDVEKYQKRN